FRTAPARACDSRTDAPGSDPCGPGISRSGPDEPGARPRSTARALRRRLAARVREPARGCGRLRLMRGIRSCEALGLALAWLALVIAPRGTAAPAASRPLRLSDWYQFRRLSDPQFSPDGAWVAYTVARVDSARDRY